MVYRNAHSSQSSNMRGTSKQQASASPHPDAFLLAIFPSGKEALQGLLVLIITSECLYEALQEPSLNPRTLLLPNWDAWTHEPYQESSVQERDRTLSLLTVAPLTCNFRDILPVMKSIRTAGPAARTRSAQSGQPTVLYS